MHRPTIRAWAVAALVALLLSGCTAPEAEPAGAVTLAPGTTAHLLLSLNALDDADAVAVSVRDDAGLEVTVPPLHGDGTGAAGWVGVEAPADAEPGTHEVLLDVEGAETERVALTVTVAAPDEPLGQGATALVELTLRTQNGTVVSTNRADVDTSPLPRTADYQPPQSTEPQALPLSGQQLPTELVGPLAAAGVNQSLTVEMPDFFGPEEQESQQPRNETVQRTQELERYVEMPRAQAEQQGLVTAETREGDVLRVAGPVPYVVEALDNETFRAEVDLRQGDSVPLHPMWPNATAVTQRDQQMVVLRTDPPVDEGEPFTWNPDWPEATHVTSVNDEAIALRHTPEVGTTYTAQTQQGGVETTIVDVGPANITISQANPHPLAGQSIFLEMTVVGEQAAMPGGLPGA